jgi:alkylated DNA nucleotide flippase Atl1
MIKSKSPKTWKEKLEKEIDPKVVEIPEKWARKIGHGKMLVPSPILVDQVIKKIPRGRLATVNTIRNYMADTYNADMACPLTTGIFLTIAAHAAEEDKNNGKIKVTPYWRVLKEGGRLNQKFPGGMALQAKYLVNEGFDIVKGKTGNIFFVKNYENKLAQLS